MKPEIFILMERKFKYREIVDITGYPLKMIYRYGAEYKKGCKKIDFMRKVTTK